VRTLLSRLACLVAAAATGLAVPAGALAATHPVTPGSADFSVSTAAQSLRPEPGGVVHTQLTVANNGVHELTVTLRSVGVRAQDNGRADFVEQGDPIWSKAVTMVSSVRLAAHTFRSIPVAIRVPAGLLPDLYLLGFVAEAQPVDPQAPVLLYHRIGALVTVELPGPRERKLAVHIAPTSFLHLGSSYDGAFVVRNVGTAAALARDQVLIGSQLTHHAVGMIRTSDAMELIPSGTARNVPFRYAVHGFFLYARPQAEVIYGNGTSAMQTITVQGQSMLVVPWLTLILLGLVVAMVTAYLIWQRRRREARRRAAARRARTGRHRAAPVAWAR
jgi:hypothetical protein